ncbi:mitochondrial carrier domain-containing protein [Kickxella alabastrina]|uniref:mitochondrial carrier domain-containing protein n=1 Tax=Kickxella alabastrina TaxID=61397 RepID=UPI002220FC87|nr:mitochondrial carrier domain-containing protein [Kickxella alabastrina]KAI7822453.1 mitochondrial carrier domain-containing protein [Kickxella alabastrina]
MHERDHYWASGGIPPHREKDHTDKAPTEPGAAEMKTSVEESFSHDKECVVQALIADIKTTGALLPSTSSAVHTTDSDTASEAPCKAEESKWQQSLKSSIAGAGAGCVSSVVTCPLDLVKTRLQYQGVLEAKYSGNSGGISGYRPYGGTVNTLRRIVGEEGVLGLYRGLAPMLMGYLPTWGIYFTAYEALKREVPRQFPTVSNTGVHVVSAMGAGATTSVLTNPIWVLKSRFMTQSKFTEYRYSSMWDAVTVIRRTEGLGGFYKGLGSSLLGVTHVAVQFPLYEALKAWMGVDSSHVESSRILAASAASKMVASSVTYPHEVIRTRLQNQTRAPFKYAGICHAVVLIYREEGVRAFYRGLATNLIRTVPASMMTLLTYELLIRVL